MDGVDEEDVVGRDNEVAVEIAEDEAIVVADGEDVVLACVVDVWRMSPRTEVPNSIASLIKTLNGLIPLGTTVG